MKSFVNYIIIIFTLLIATETYSQSSFSATRLEQAAVSYLQKQFSSNTVPSFLMKFPDVNFKSSNIKAKFDYVENINSSIQKLDVLFFDNNDLIRKIEIPFKIKIQKEVVVTNRDIPPNSILKEDDLITVSRDVEDFNQILSEINQAVGKLTNRRISKGDIIRKNDLQQPQIVKRGQNVNIEVISGSVKIYSTGVSLQDGSVGDKVRVRRENDNTKSTIEATVVGENLVQINLR